MKIYTVHEPATPGVPLKERAEKIVFVKEGFSWLGFFLPPVFLIAKALWLEFIAFLVLTALLTAGLRSMGLAEEGPGLVWLFMMFLLGYVGNDLIRWRLERKNYVLLGSVLGHGSAECEQRFFALWLPIAAGEATGGGRGGAEPASSTAPSQGLSGWHGPSVIGAADQA